MRRDFFRLWVLDFKNNIYEEYDIPKEYKYVLGNSLLAYSIKIDDKDRLFIAQRPRLLYTKEAITSVIETSKIESELSVFPNPTIDYITINLGSIGANSNGASPIASIEIYDVMGIKIHSTPVETNTSTTLSNRFSSLQKIDVSNLSPGVYFVKIGDKVEKFVKY